MKLKSFGCSLIYGSDLKDCAHGVDEHNPPPSRFTWPSLLAARLGIEYQCFARPASGNLQILETLLSSIQPRDSHLYVINWTWIERFSFVTDAAKTGNHPWNPMGWCSILPVDQNAVADTYYRHIHSQFRDKLEALICIKTAIDIMQDQKIRFLMTYTDELLFETEWHMSPAISCLQNYVKSSLHNFQGQGFWCWSKDGQYAISDKWHPLEEAHAAAADLMTPVIGSILHRA